MTELIGGPFAAAYGPALLLADALDDLERVRIGTENRIRSLRQDGDDNPILTSVGGQLGEIEKQLTKAIEREMRKHPLGPWIQAQVGIGLKQSARLLRATGDPYWHTLKDQPRTISQLWAYCGLHTLPATDQPSRDIQGAPVSSGNQPAGGDLDHGSRDTQVRTIQVAARHRKGQKSNWSDEAKMRVWNISNSCIKQLHSPYRVVYDARRAATAERLHAAACVRCGPAGKPAQLGSPWSPGHQHADALRIVGKRVLRDLWRTSRDLHNELQG